MAVTKRFIAGATCPQCGALDTVAVFVEGDHEWVACIRCDYREDKPLAPAEGGSDVQIVHLD